jgi:gluconate kinase
MQQPSGTSMTDEQRLAWLEAQAEAAYDKMYDATNGTEAAARYSDAKEALSDAIGLAHRLGHATVATRLETRLAHIKAVFRSQFG